MKKFSITKSLAVVEGISPNSIITGEAHWVGNGGPLFGAIETIEVEMDEIGRNEANPVDYLKNEWADNREHRSWEATQHPINGGCGYVYRNIQVK